MQWLITGCSSGLGLSLARAVLTYAEEKVIATSRNPASSPEAIEEITSEKNGCWEVLDVASSNLEKQLLEIVSKHGPIDVLVNNAGYAEGGVLETTSIETLRKQFETNFFGVARLIQTITPVMRSNKRGGTIVNVSSAEFWQPHPATSAYSSSKWALEGLSESLATELAPFNIRVLIAEPGGMRTAFLDPKKISGSLAPMPDAYKGTIADYVTKALLSTHGSQDLDPEKSARAIVKEVLEPTLAASTDVQEHRKILRLQLGGESVNAMQKKILMLSTEANEVRAQALACDFSGT